MSSAPPFLLQLPPPHPAEGALYRPAREAFGPLEAGLPGQMDGRTDGHVSWEVRQTEKQAEGGSSRTAKASKNIM